MKHTVSAALAVAICTGCGGSSERAVVEFPSRDALERMAARSGQPVPPSDTTAVDRWTIESPVPAPGATYPSENAWDRMLAERHAASASKPRLAPELRCAAQEAARFYVQNHAFPDDALREYLLLRCGSTLVSASEQSVSGAVPDDTPDGKLETSYAESARKLIATALGGGSEVGVGFARGNGRAAVVALYGTPAGRVLRYPGLVQDANVTLEGEVAPDASFVLGFANQGELGVSLCEPDTTVRLPMFRLNCGMANGDAQARVEIVMLKQGQVLMHPSLQLLVRRQADAGLTYEARALASVAPAANAGAFRAAVVEGLNQARSQAGARPLTLEANQSQVSDRLVSPYFGSALQGNTQEVETMALGLLAGWDVAGTIRNGGFYSQLAAASRSPGRWLNTALASPLGRWSLLDKDMARVAIGTGMVAPAGVMALVTTYSFFESSDHRSDEDDVFARLVRARKDHGAPPPMRVPSDATLDGALSKITINASTTGAALEEVMEHIANDEHRAVRGWYVETSDLKQIPFAGDLLVKRPIEVQIGVTHHRAPGGAWGQYAVIIAIVGTPPADSKEAHLLDVRRPRGAYTAL